MKTAEGNFPHCVRQIYSGRADIDGIHIHGQRFDGIQLVFTHAFQVLRQGLL